MRVSIVYIRFDRTERHSLLHRGDSKQQSLPVNSVLGSRHSDLQHIRDQPIRTGILHRCMERGILSCLVVSGSLIF